MVLQAFVDDSGIGQPPVYILAGWIADAAKWADFLTEWDRVLRMSPRIRYFKFAEAMGWGVRRVVRGIPRREGLLTGQAHREI
jgi:hypothetical protein